MALSDKEIDIHRCLLMYGDETVFEAIGALFEAKGGEWWYLVVDLGEGRYAVAEFETLHVRLEQKGRDYLDTLLADLTEKDAPRVQVVVEQGATSLQDLEDMLRQHGDPAGVVLAHGEFRGVIPNPALRQGAKRGAIFDSGLITLAGRYRPIPARGTLRPGTRRVSSPSMQKKPRR